MTGRLPCCTSCPRALPRSSLVRVQVSPAQSRARSHHAAGKGCCLRGCRDTLLNTSPPTALESYAAYKNCPVSHSQKKPQLYIEKWICDLLKLSLIYKQDNYNFGLLIWLSSKTNGT